MKMNILVENQSVHSHKVRESNVMWDMGQGGTQEGASESPVCSPRADVLNGSALCSGSTHWWAEFLAPAAVLDTSQGRNDTQGRKASDPAATTFPVPLLVPDVAAVGQVQLVEAPGSWCPALPGSLAEQRGKVGLYRPRKKGWSQFSLALSSTGSEGLEPRYREK